MLLKFLFGGTCGVILFMFQYITVTAQDSSTDTLIKKPKGISEIINGDGELQDSARPFFADTNIKQSVLSIIEKREAIYQQWKWNFPSIIAHSDSETIGMPNDQFPRIKQHDDWKFYLSFFLLAVLAMIRYSYSREFDELSSVFRNWGPSQQMYRELGTGASFGTVLLNFFSAVVLSFYVFLLLYRYHAVEVTPAWVLMLLSLVTVSAFLLIRYASLKLTSLLLPFQKEVTLYNYYEIQINQMLSVWLFPLTMMIAFAQSPFDEVALYASFLVLVLFILCRYAKGFNIGINYFGRHLFHFLLYICALEIAPVLVIIRLIKNLGPLSFSY